MAAAVADGAGRASLCAGRTLRDFGRQVGSGALDVSRFPAWRPWLTAVDAGFAGGPQTTFVGIAVVDDRIAGASAGDSRAFLVSEHGCRLVTTSRSPRLGSGKALPAPIHEAIASRDVVLLMSDGAWGPLRPSAIFRTVAAHATRHFAELPGALLDLPEANGRSDEMTNVAIRARR